MTDDMGLVAVQARIDQLLAWVRDKRATGDLPDIWTLQG